MFRQAIINNNFAQASRFFVHLFLYRRWTTTTWNCLISRFVEDGNKRQLSFSLTELWCSPLEFSSKKHCQHLTNWMRWYKRDKVWGSTNSLFKWHFCSCRHHHCINSLILIQVDNFLTKKWYTKGKRVLISGWSFCHAHFVEYPPTKEKKSTACCLKQSSLKKKLRMFTVHFKMLET